MVDMISLVVMLLVIYMYLLDGYPKAIRSKRWIRIRKITFGIRFLKALRIMIVL